MRQKRKEKQEFSDKWEAQKKTNEEKTGDPELTQGQKVDKETDRLGEQVKDKANRVGKELGKVFK